MIYVNARFLTQEVTGVQRFAEMISLSLNNKINNITFLCPSGVLRESVGKKLNVKLIGNCQGHFWEQVELPLFLKKNGSPLLINLGSTGPIFYRNKIVTHHDITYLKYPRSYSVAFLIFYKIVIPFILRTSRHLITVSQFSREEIVNAYNYPKENISVVYNATDESFRPASTTETPNDDRYLLSVSSRNFHKNHHGMIGAFKRALQISPENKNIKIKIIGKTARSFSKQGYALECNSDNIEFLGRVNDEELINLYQNATAFIFPSFYEGFGIPPLEAQSCGCPVISSNAASMPEVLAESVLYFDPHSLEDMSEKINRIMMDENLRGSLSQKGLKNTRRFSWEKSAEELIKIINKFV
ncbi:glycosyltransferase family 4 protein [Serratia marcescens]|nr:glycosyltransferase family 4 protein [Serratia marcescens]